MTDENTNLFGSDPPPGREELVVVSVQLVIALPFCEGGYEDAVNELLRESQRNFSENSCLIDYAVGVAVGIPDDPKNYTEGDAFIQI